jgi:signal transduction histidine kinase
MILKFISDMADPVNRYQSAIKLAEHFKCSYFFVLIKDAGNNALLPAPGFPQTLLIDSRWDKFLAKTSVKLFHQGSLPYPDRNNLLKATGVAGPFGSAALLLGGAPTIAELEQLTATLPLLVALFMEEDKRLSAQNLASFALSTASKAEKLTKTIDSMRLLLKEGLVKQEKDKQAIEELLKKKDEFINIASHELKTPMTSLKGYLQILSRNGLDEATKENFFNKAKMQADKVTGLVNDLLNVSKMQSGQMTLDISKFNLTALVRDVVNAVQLTNQTHRVDIVADKDFIVTGDQSRLEQVLSNLLINAIKYSPDADSVIITVVEEGHQITVKVKDFGIGIENEQIPYLFDRFFRSPGVVKTFSGLGLGLYISKEIVLKHGGSIGVTSELLKGSTFWFSIPASPVFVDN